jgi:phage terminase small subunit
MITDPRRQAIFIAEYLKDYNGKRAAIACGSSETSAPARSSELLNDPNIKAEIRKKTQERLDNLEIDGDLILRELAKLAYSNSSDFVQVQADGTAYVDLSKCTREQMACIAEVYTEEIMEGRDDSGRTIRKTKVKFHDKKGALELLGKHKKLFTDKHEFGGPDGAPLGIKVEFI